MQTRRRHRLGLTALALLTSAVTVPAQVAHAAPVFTSAFYASATAGAANPSGCTVSQTASAPVDEVPVPENGSSLTASASTTGTVTKNGDNADKVGFGSRFEATAGIESTGADPRIIDLAVAGTFETSTTKPVAGCEVNLESFFRLEYEVTVPRAGFLTVTMKSGAHTYSEFYLEDLDSDRFFDLDTGPTFDGVSAAFIPAGTYVGLLAANTFVRTNKAIPTTPIRSSVHAEFVVAGSQTAAPVGKATRYVELSESRSCDTDSLDATVTAKRQRAKTIKQVRVFVNDELVNRVRTPRKRQLVKARVADEVAAEVRVEVALRATKPGRPGKSYEATASYVPCS